MSLRSRNSKLQEKIALFEEREKQLAAQQAALRPRSVTKDPNQPGSSGSAVAGRAGAGEGGGGGSGSVSMRSRPPASAAAFLAVTQQGSAISSIISRLPIAEHEAAVRKSASLGPHEDERLRERLQRARDEEDAASAERARKMKEEEEVESATQVSKTSVEVKEDQVSKTNEEAKEDRVSKTNEEVKEDRVSKANEEVKEDQQLEQTRIEEEIENERQRKIKEEQEEQEEQERQRQIREKEEEERKLREKQEEEERARQRRLKEEEEERERLRKLKEEEEERGRIRREKEERERMAATRIQSRWRMRQAVRKFQVMRKMNQYRTQVAEEILSTEETYVSTLRDVADLMIKPLKEAVASGKPIISNDEIKTIFSNIQIILGYNDALLEDLREKIGSWHPAQMVGDVFLKMAAFMKVYTDYVRNFNDALSTIQECKKSPEFLNFLQETYSKMSVVQSDLSSYLITPVQRIPRYQLLLRDMLKHTWKEHIDYENLEQALQQITTTAMYVNDKQKEAENIQKMLSIQSSLYGKKLVNLVDPHRRFLREGALVEIKAKGKGKPRWFILFNDLLVKCDMTNTMKKKTIKKGATPSFEYLGQLPLEGCELVNSGDEGDKKHGFQVNTTSSSLWLCASSEEEKIEWMKDIKDCIKSLKEKSDFYDEQATKIASQRAAAAKALIAEQYTGYRVRGTYAPPSSGRRTGEYRKTASGSLEVVDESDHDTNKSSMRALSAQERFHLAKQAEQRLSQLLEEEKLQEQLKQDMSHERVKNFKDSMGRRYTGSSELLTDASDEDDESSDCSVSSEMSESSEMPTRTASGNVLPEEESSADSGPRGRRRFASMKREHYRGSSSGSNPGSKNNSGSSSPREEREEAAQSPPTPTKADSPVAPPRTRKFASLKREDYRGASRSGRYSLPAASANTSTTGAAGAAVAATLTATVTTTAAAIVTPMATNGSTTNEEESDVVIHEDQAPVGVPAYLMAQKRNFATGRQKYPSVHSKELIKNATEEFGDVTDILTQMKHSKTDKPSRVKRASHIPSTKKDDSFDNFKQAVELAEEEDEKGASLSGADKKQRKKKFASLRNDKNEDDKSCEELSGEENGKKKQFGSLKREDYKAQSAAFAAIEMKDMVAASKTLPNGDGAPKRRFASMKRENYRSLQQALGDADKGEKDETPKGEAS